MRSWVYLTHFTGELQKFIYWVCQSREGRNLLSILFKDVRDRFTDVIGSNEDGTVTKMIRQILSSEV